MDGTLSGIGGRKSRRGRTTHAKRESGAYKALLLSWVAACSGSDRSLQSEPARFKSSAMMAHRSALPVPPEQSSDGRNVWENLNKVLFLSGVLLGAGEKNKNVKLVQLRNCI